MVETIHLVITGDVPKNIRAYVDERMANDVIRDARDFDCEEKMSVVSVDLERYSAYDRRQIPWNPPEMNQPIKRKSTNVQDC